MCSSSYVLVTIHLRVDAVTVTACMSDAVVVIQAVVSKIHKELAVRVPLLSDTLLNPRCN